MDVARRQPSARAVVLVGVMYALIGVTFAWPSNYVRVWRLAAWVISAGAYAAHVAYEHFTLRNSSRLTALHAAAAVAIGAIGLAAAGMIHDLATTSTIRPAWLFALVALPAVTAVPAFVVALVAGALLGRLRRSADAG